MTTSIYEVELAAPDGTVLASMAGRADNRQFTLTRNAPDTIQWTVDLDEFERWCQTSHQDPRQVLVSNNTEVRIKRQGAYLAAGQLNYKEGDFTADTGGNTLQLRAQGFLGLFSNRFTTSNAAGIAANPGSQDDQVYTNEDASQVGWDLINTNQSGLNDYGQGTTPEYWDFGITAGSLPAVGLHTRDYQDMAILDALNDFNNVNVGNFDMRIGYDKVFNTYAQIGVQRPDIVLEMPGNIVSASIIEDGTQVANFIVAQGSGNGSVALQDAISFSESSAQSYGYRVMIVTPSSLDSADESLQNYADWTLSQYSVPFVLPTVTYDGAIGPSPTSFNVGDWIRIIIKNHPLYQDINGMYRVEQMQVNADKNDVETVQITTSLN